MYLNGHDTCNDWHSDPNASTVGMELKKSLCFKEELCDDKVSSGIHLLFEVLKVFFVRGTVWMPVRVTWREGGRERKQL